MENILRGQVIHSVDVLDNGLLVFGVSKRRGVIQYYRIETGTPPRITLMKRSVKVVEEVEFYPASRDDDS